MTWKKTVETTIAVFLLIATTMMLTPMVANAQNYKNMQEGGSMPLPAGVTPDLSIPATAFLSFRPNPVGVGQTILVNMWLNPATHVSRYFKEAYKVTFTKPDGTIDVVGPMNSYRADTTAWFEYPVDQVGTWKVKFEFLGGYFPPGNYTVLAGAFVGPQVVSFTQSSYYQPDSTPEQTLVVQETQVMSWPPSPLPTDYWTRPVSPEHREWWSILGDYPGTGTVGGGPYWPADTNIYMNPDYSFIPYVQAPSTAHIVWERQDEAGGLIGGNRGQESLTSGGNTPSIILFGRCYDSFTKVVDGQTKTVFQCYDLRTGEVYWEKTDVTQFPTVVYYGSEATGTVVAETGSYVGRQLVELMYIGGGRIIRYDPWNGAVTFNMSIAPLTTGEYYGTNPLFLSVQNLGSSVPTDQRYRLINWTIKSVHTGSGYVYSYSVDVLGNVSWPWSNLGTSWDLEAGIAATTSSITPSALGAYFGATIQAASMKTGQLLWTTNVDDTIYSSSCTVADHGKVAALMMGGYYLAWDLTTGRQVWKSEAMDYPWGEPAFGAYDATSAYGLFYRQSYDGVYAFDWDTGKIVWKYTAPTPYSFETPYISDVNGQEVYSWNGGSSVADGKLYTYNTEHTQSQPITRGWGLHCINATTGEGIWSISSQMSPGGMADGYLTASCTYDGFMYVFGMGKSATTVTAPDTVIAKGAGVVIKGTVMDLSPAQPNTPCVSKASMGTQMEYLHMQGAINGVWGNESIVGVPVSLTALSSDGNSIDLGTVTTDGYYGTFSKSWIPPAEGDYTIIASFAGDESYGSSSASTAISVGPAPTSTNTGQQEVTIPDYTMTIIYGVVAIIIVVAIAAIAIILMLRKR